MIVSQLAVLCLAIDLAVAQSSPPLKANKVPFKKVHYSSDPSDSLIKRDNFEELDLRHLGVLYTAEIEVGSRKTDIEVIVDTGSADSWIFDSSSAVCDLSYLEIGGSGNGSTLRYSDQVATPSSQLLSELEELGIAIDGEISANYQGNSLVKRRVAPFFFDIDISKPVCDQFGSFNPSSSNTFQSNDTDFSITYVDNVFAQGTWVRDTFRLGQFAIDQQSFALVNVTNNFMGVLGLGPSTQQITNSDSNDNGYTYLGVVDSLRAQGFINSSSYSVYLVPDGQMRDNNHDDGEILFGAIDKAKINGELKLFPYVNPYKSVYPDQYASYVTISSISVTTFSSNRRVERIPQLALLDTGSTFSYLPTYTLIRVALAISPYFEYVPQLGLFVVNADSVSNSGLETIDFHFGDDVVIRSNITDHLIDVSHYFLSGRYTALTIQESTDGLCVLGDTFIKSAYLFFDNENSELGIGQIRVTRDEDIQEAGEFTLERDSGYSSTWSIYSYETSMGAFSTGTGWGTYEPYTGYTRSVSSTTQPSTTLQPRTTVTYSTSRLRLNSRTDEDSQIETSLDSATSLNETGLLTALRSSVDDIPLTQDSSFRDSASSTTFTSNGGAPILSLGFASSIFALLSLIL